MLQVERLKKFYGKHMGIERVDFNISKGEVYGLIGPNGSGKTTTIRIILGLLSADEGKVYMEGKELPQHLIEMKHRMGYLPGEINFYPDMRVSRFLKYNRQFYKTYSVAYEDYLCRFLDLDQKKKFKELSLGNRKKVGIIQALVHQPDLLILDEPTNGLDPLLQKNFYELIHKERERGCAILFSSHNLMEVERLSNRVGIIKNGVLIKEMSINQFSEYQKKIITVFKMKPNQLWEAYKPIQSMNSTVVFQIKKTQIKAFLSLLNQQEYEDVQIRNPTLEETFMDLYTKGGDHDGSQHL
ncbi:MAG TPA: ABC transporter ATP-binding protein [Thermotogota bacterium]|nr:ABC transporter ATP-binding protein [Thermotogota bacterium]HRW35643.1 ABC transporter ATP-binding protein [Thermotogota bacterium]